MKKEFLIEFALATLVFADAEKLALLNSFVHPATIQDAESWMNSQEHRMSLKKRRLSSKAGWINTLTM